jgi:hypothetical protein
MYLRPISFAQASDDDALALDRLAMELRTSKRKRQLAEGLPIQQALDAFFMEHAGKVGCR